MGTWDTDSFQNDAASDWAFEQESAADLGHVSKTLLVVVKTGDDYLEVDEGQEALAAAEVVARLKGNWGQRDPYSEPVDKWIQNHPQTPSDDLVDLALKAIDRVNSEPSELLELWGESGSDDWKQCVSSLRERVGAEPHSVAMECAPDPPSPKKWWQFWK